MNLRDVLAIRLRSFMDSRPDLDTQVKVHQKAKVSQSTVGRTLSRSAAATVDVIEDLARAFGADPVEFLIADNQALDIYRSVARLKPDERSQLLGYLKVISSDAMRHHGPMHLSFETATAVPAKLQAATERASSRDPWPEDAEKKDVRGKHVEKRRGKRA